MPAASYMAPRRPPIRTAAVHIDTHGTVRRKAEMMHTLSPTPRNSLVARWAFASAAAVTALFLMVFYVQLLQDSVARGAQWRYSQSTAQPAKAVAPAVAVRLVGTAR